MAGNRSPKPAVRVQVPSLPPKFGRVKGPAETGGCLCGSTVPPTCPKAGVVQWQNVRLIGEMSVVRIHSPSPTER